jgi:Rieske Fe-S protein
MTTLEGTSGTMSVPELQAEYLDVERLETGTGFPTCDLHFTRYENGETVQLSVTTDLAKGPMYPLDGESRICDHAGCSFSSTMGASKACWSQAHDEVTFLMPCGRVHYDCNFRLNSRILYVPRYAYIRRTQG